MQAHCRAIRDPGKGGAYLLYLPDIRYLGLWVRTLSFPGLLAKNQGLGIHQADICI